MNAPPPTTRRAALFDMDRTLVSVNSGGLYVRWRMRRREYSLSEGLSAARILFQYGLGWVDAPAVAARSVRDLSGYSETRMRAECRQWYGEMVRRHVSTRARDEVKRCQDAGYEVAILTGQTNYAAEPLAEDLGIDQILCSRLRVQADCFTGELEPPLCYGVGKVELAGRWARAGGIDLSRSRFYSDSITDLPMLDAVGEPRIINPDPRLWLTARARRWPVEIWK